MTYICIIAMKKKDFNWMILFWIGIITLFIWLVLKEFGYINTPDLIRIIPYLGGLIALVGLIKNFGGFEAKLEMLIIDVKDIKSDIKEIKLDIHSLDKRVTLLEAR
mgnify:CR=1 FL=1